MIIGLVAAWSAGPVPPPLTEYCNIVNICLKQSLGIIIIVPLELSKYHDSIHYCDSLKLFINKIVDYLTIRIVISYKIYRKCDKFEYNGNLTLTILDNCTFTLPSIMIFMN